MPGLTRVNGGTGAIELIGRDIDWVLIDSTGIDTTPTAVDSNLEIAMRVVEQYGTVTIVGTPATSAVRFAVEGLSANAAVLDTALAAAISGNTPATTVHTGLSGAVFA